MVLERHRLLPRCERKSAAAVSSRPKTKHFLKPSNWFRRKGRERGSVGNYCNGRACLYPSRVSGFPSPLKKAKLITPPSLPHHGDVDLRCFTINLGRKSRQLNQTLAFSLKVVDSLQILVSKPFSGTGFWVSDSGWMLVKRKGHEQR